MRDSQKSSEMGHNNKHCNDDIGPSNVSFFTNLIQNNSTVLQSWSKRKNYTMYAWITILLATAIQDFNSGFSGTQKKASDQSSQKYSDSSINIRAKFLNLKKRQLPVPTYRL